MNAKKPGKGTAQKSSFPYKAKVSSPLGKGRITGAGEHPYAKKGK